MFKLKLYSQLLFLLLTFLAIFSSGCSIFSVKNSQKTAVLLKTEDASKEKMINEVNRFAKVNSMRAKVDVKFEDNSFASEGIAEKYKTADGEIVVQRPANILLKVSVPIVKYDVAQMTSDGTKFRVAILNDGGSGKNKKFVIGTNNADYSKLQRDLSSMDLDIDKSLKQQVSAFANLRPQHFTDAMLVRPTDNSDTYTVSTIFQEEDLEAIQKDKKKTSMRVLRGYYLLDEYKNTEGELIISRRFWFDRVGGIRLARQQIFDAKGEIETDVVYGQEGNLAGNPEYTNLPMRVTVTRPKEKYKMSLTYQTPENVTIGKNYPTNAFVLQNTWNLPEVDLDKKLSEVSATNSASNTSITNK
jgi:hypothetical protein